MSKPTNPRCFFDIEIAGRKAGRLIFELFANEVPKTVENFRALCTGERGRSATSGATLHYKGSPIHRIVEGFMLQGGDFTTGDGKGGESIYGGAFADESFERKHTAEFLLSMANRGPNTNGSQFFITCVPTPHLDGKHVVFGRLVSGQDLVREIEVLPVDKKSRPHDQVLISNSGELERVVTKRRKSPSVHSDSSEEGRNSRKKKEKKRRRRRSPSTSGSSSSSESSVSSSEEQDRKRKSKEKRKPKKSKRSSTAEPQEAVDSAPAEEYVGIAPPDDIGGTSNFLMRNLDTRDTRRRPTMLSTEKRVDKAGRVVKGRGSLQFGTDRTHRRNGPGPRDYSRRDDLWDGRRGGDRWESHRGDHWDDRRDDRRDDQRDDRRGRRDDKGDRRGDRREVRREDRNEDLRETLRRGVQVGREEVVSGDAPNVNDSRNGSKSPARDEKMSISNLSAADSNSSSS